MHTWQPTRQTANHWHYYTTVQTARSLYGTGMQDSGEVSWSWVTTVTNKEPQYAIADHGISGLMQKVLHANDCTLCCLEWLLLALGLLLSFSQRLVLVGYCRCYISAAAATVVVVAATTTTPTLG